MPRIFDNIEQRLLPALQETLKVADHADFCVGYFNLRGWKQLDCLVERWNGGEGNCCRLLVGMQRLPDEELRQALTLAKRTDEIDNQTAEGCPVPVGTQDTELLDSRVFDEDADAEDAAQGTFGDENGEEDRIRIEGEKRPLRTEADFKKRAAEVYAQYATKFQRRFRWLRPGLFIKSLSKDLRSDAVALLGVLKKSGEWDPSKDAKLVALFNLVGKEHSGEKVLVFTQFADTVHYLESELRVRGITRMAGVTGGSPDPTGLAWRFSPVSNEKRQQVSGEDELRVLVATDVLSEGQNLQDCSIVVNYDLPWAIIRLVQRAGRVDRIGQKSEKIFCNSFLPADGVERIIRLRGRVRQRLRENSEVVGTDEAFFEDDQDSQSVLNLYNEKAGILDGEDDTEVDLASYAYQIWKNAITADPKLEQIIPALPPVAYSTRAHQSAEKAPAGVLVYLRTGEGNDALAWVDKEANAVSESQFTILKAAECLPKTRALPRQKNHHQLVRKAVELVMEEEKNVGGQLGRPSGARFRAYTCLKDYAEKVKGTLFESKELLKAIEEIYRYPLRSSATDTLNRQLRSGIADQQLAELVVALRDDGRLCQIDQEQEEKEPQIICSMGLSDEPEGD